MMRVLLSEAMSRFGVSSAVGSIYRGRGTIFMLHSVVDDTERYLGQTIRCSLGVLERALRWVRDQGMDIVSLDTARERLARNETRPFVVFTFDDGYRDNLTRVLPLMQRFEAPFTVFVPTHFITRELNGWWLGLVPLVRDNDVIFVEAMDRRFDLSTRALKREAMTEIGRWVFEDGSRAARLVTTFNTYGISLQALLDEEALTLGELRQIAASPLVTIGAHTVTHRFLNRLQPHEVAEEMRDNKRDLQNWLDIAVDHFAYPYGAAGPREARLAREAGFSTAVTTANGTLFDRHSTLDLRHTLPRETLDEHDTPGCLHCRTRGVYRFLKSRGGSPIAAFRSS